MVQILIKLEENETANPLYQSAVNTHSKTMINEYIALDNSFKPFRNQFLQLLKSQLQSLIKLKAGILNKMEKNPHVKTKVPMKYNVIYIYVYFFLNRNNKINRENYREKTCK